MRRRILAPLLALLLTGAAVLMMIVVFFVGIALTVPTPSTTQSQQPSDQAADATLRALVEAPAQIIAMAFGGHLHGAASTGLGVISLDARVRSVTVLVLFALLCRQFSRQGLRPGGLAWRDAAVGAAISGMSMAVATSFLSLALGIDASTREGGVLFTAFSPMLPVGAFTITAAVVFLALLAPRGSAGSTPALDTVRLAIGVVLRLLGIFTLGLLVVGMGAVAVEVTQRPPGHVLGPVLMSPLAWGSAALAALGTALGGSLDWQVSLPFTHLGTVSLASAPLAAALGTWAALVVALVLTARRWAATHRGLRVTWPGARWWLLPVAFLLAGVASLWLVDASGWFSASGAGGLGGRLRLAPWTPIGWAVLGLLVEGLSRILPARRR